MALLFCSLQQILGKYRLTPEVFKSFVIKLREFSYYWTARFDNRGKAALPTKMRVMIALDCLGHGSSCNLVASLYSCGREMVRTILKKFCSDVRALFTFSCNLPRT